MKYLGSVLILVATAGAPLPVSASQCADELVEAAGASGAGGVRALDLLVCLQELSSELREAKSQLELYIQASKSSATLSLSDQMRRSIPNAIVAFQGADGCPQGWSPYAEAESRFLVGAASGRRAETGGLSLYPAGSVGGSQETRLLPQNMPPHSHEVEVTHLTVRSGKGLGGSGTRGDVTPSPTRYKSTEVGRAESFSNIPPYVAVTFCRLDQK